jgi:hypothetical protein
MKSRSSVFLGLKTGKVRTYNWCLFLQKKEHHFYEAPTPTLFQIIYKTSTKNICKIRLDHREEGDDHREEGDDHREEGEDHTEEGDSGQNIGLYERRDKPKGKEEI